MSNQQEQEPVYLTSTNDDNLVFVKKKKSFRSQAFSQVLMQSTTGVSMCVYSTTLQRVQ